MSQKQLGIMIAIRDKGYRMDGEDIIGTRGGVIKGYIAHNGYRVLNSPTIGGKRYSVMYHRLKYFLSTGDEQFLLEGMEIHHINGNRSDNFLSNLQVVSPHSHRSHHSKGEEHNLVKLTEGEVRSIRVEYASGGVTQRELAAKYGVSRGHISDIASGKYWASLDD